MQIDIEPTPYSPEVEVLLGSCGLPVSDLATGSVAEFFGCRVDQALTCVIGIERYGTVGLLRSLAVPERARNAGIGRRLVRHVERWAQEHGVETLYLLTTTTADFFARLGYTVMSRGAAPVAIAQTAQFSGLCPASSTFMCKALSVKNARRTENAAVAADRDDRPAAVREDLKS